MARSLSEIYNQIIAQKEAQAELSTLSPAAGETFSQLLEDLMARSKVSIWRLWAFVVSFYIWTHEKQNDIFQQEMIEWAATKQVPTLKWYRGVVLGFLFGKPLIWSETSGSFYQELLPTDDEDTLKIVKYCAVTKSPGFLRVKVATDSGGVPSTLSAAQSAAVEAFLDQVKAAGDTIELVNNPADQLNIELDVYVDPLVIDITTGELHLQAGVNPVMNALNEYLLNLEFNGRLVKNYMIDAMQAAEGVSNIDLNVLQHKYLGFPYADIDVSVVPDAGYFVIDTISVNYLPAED